MTYRRLPRLEPAHHVEVRKIFTEEAEKLRAKLPFTETLTVSVSPNSEVSEGSESEVERDH